MAAVSSRNISRARCATRSVSLRAPTSGTCVSRAGTAVAKADGERRAKRVVQRAMSFADDHGMHLGDGLTVHEMRGGTDCKEEHVFHGRLTCWVAMGVLAGAGVALGLTTAAWRSGTACCSLLCA
jgi:hypothetical protein